MTSGDELLSCPFCGGAAEVREWDFPYVRFQARCVECKTTGRTRFNERAKAIAAWNRRTPPTPATDAREAVALEDCPIGLFISRYGSLCLKTEYGDNNGRIDAYIVSSGELFWGDPPQTVASQRASMVTPVDYAAEILAAEENERARIVTWMDEQYCLNDDCRLDMIAAIERNEHGSGK